MYHSIAALRRRVGPHIAEAVEHLMAGCAGGAEPIRIKINLYGDDDDDSAIHSLQPQRRTLSYGRRDADESDGWNRRVCMKDEYVYAFEALVRALCPY